MLKGSTLTSMKVPRTALRSNSRSVPRRRERELELDWSRVVQEAYEVGCRNRDVSGYLAELPVKISSLVPEVGADGKDDAVEATCPVLVRDEAVAWR